MIEDVSARSHRVDDLPGSRAKPPAEASDRLSPVRFWTRGSNDLTRGSNDVTRGSSNATRRSSNVTHGSSCVTRGSSHATRGSSNATRGSSDWTSGSSDATRGASNTTRGSSDLTRGSSDVTRGSNHWTRGSRSAIRRLVLADRFCRHRRGPAPGSHRKIPADRENLVRSGAICARPGAPSTPRPRRSPPPLPRSRRRSAIRAGSPAPIPRAGVS